MRFEWNEAKNRENAANHAISFEEARLVFEDPLHLSVIDHRFGYFEERWITVGMAGNKGVVVAAHLYFDDEDEEVIRIISARPATKRERKQYEG